MLNKSDYIAVGIVQKTFGIGGECIVKLFKASVEDILEMESVFLDIDGGLVPFFIEHARRKGKDKVQLKFKEIKSEERAEEFLQTKVYFDTSLLLDQEDEIEPDYLIGFEVFDKEFGKVGILKDIHEYSNNVVMAIDRDGTEILVPYNDDFILKLESKKKIITLDLPEGLLDLYLNS